MTGPLPNPVPGPEFNDFLFASIGEDRNGMVVSVLSSLARSDLDPWLEAARLAGLPGESATQRLTALIGALPDRAASYSDSRTVAARLVALLPRSRGVIEGPQGTPQGAWAVMRSRPWWIDVVLMALVLAGQFLIVSHQLPVKSDDPEVRVDRILPAPVPPAGPGQ